MEYLRTLGLMSGTSMDGLDCGLFDIYLSTECDLYWNCLDFKVFPYTSETRFNIEQALTGNKETILNVDEVLGNIFSIYCKKFLQGRRVDIIASHGQTVAHQDGILTKQIGIPINIHDKITAPIIYNFRQADIELGGNGAPLMPFLDWLLFKNNHKDTITINLGGVANISFIDKTGNRDFVIGFDTGPGMALIDETCKLVWDIDMDHNGLKAAKGKTNISLLNKLMEHEYFSKLPPKSTGRDQFGLNIVIDVMNNYSDINPEDLLRTFCSLTAKSISVSLKNILNINQLNPRVIISGGGTNHPILMDEIKKYLQLSDIYTSDEYGIKSKMKESLLMAVLAVARIKNIPSNMPSVSNAREKVVLGDIYRF